MPTLNMIYGQTYVVSSDGPITITQPVPAEQGGGTITKVDVTEAGGTGANQEITFTSCATTAEVTVGAGVTWVCTPGFNRGAGSAAKNNLPAGNAAFASVQRTFSTPVGNTDLYGRWIVVNPTHFGVGDLRQLKIRARGSAYATNVRMAVFEKPDSVTEEDPHLWQPSAWTYLGTSQNAVTEVGGTDSEWRFAGVRLTGRVIALCPLGNVETDWDGNTSIGVKAILRPQGDHISFMRGNGVLDYLPQLSMVMDTPVSMALQEHIADKTAHLTAEEHAQLKELLAASQS